MEFVSLERTIESIAGRVPVPEEVAEHSDLVEPWKYSEAAATLHQLMHNRRERAPRWMMPHKITGKPIFDDALAAEGLEILEYLAGWYKRQRLFRADSVAFDRTAGQELASTAHYRKYRWGKWTRSDDIGFNRPDVVRFLVEANVAFSHQLGDDRSGEHGGPPLSHRRDHETETTGIAAERKQQVDSRTGKRTAPKLALPEKADTWAKAIAATYEIMCRETGLAPSRLEVLSGP